MVSNVEGYEGLGHPDWVWDEELIRRIGTYLLLISGYRYDETVDLIKRNYAAGKDPTELLEDLELLEQIDIELWTTLINDLSGATHQ